MSEQSVGGMHSHILKKTQSQNNNRKKSPTQPQWRFNKWMSWDQKAEVCVGNQSWVCTMVSSVAGSGIDFPQSNQKILAEVLSENNSHNQSFFSWRI